MYHIYRIDNKTKARELINEFDKNEIEQNLILCSEFYPEDHVFAIEVNSSELNEPKQPQVFQKNDNGSYSLA